MEARKEEEVQFHNRLKSPLTRTRELVRLTANKKYYSVAMSSIRYYERWLLERCSGKRVLDYGCGDGKYARLLAVHGANVVGFDISDASVRKARALARVEGVEDRTWFCVADGEALNFKNDTFDIVCESGVLHHVDLAGAIVEVRRSMSPNSLRFRCPSARSSQ